MHAEVRTLPKAKSWGPRVEGRMIPSKNFQDRQLKAHLDPPLVRRGQDYPQCCGFPKHPGHKGRSYPWAPLSWRTQEGSLETCLFHSFYFKDRKPFSEIMSSFFLTWINSLFIFLNQRKFLFKKKMTWIYFLEQVVMAYRPMDRRKLTFLAIYANLTL